MPKKLGTVHIFLCIEIRIYKKEQAMGYEVWGTGFRDKGSGCGGQEKGTEQ
jgi:hypothetical protein